MASPLDESQRVAAAQESSRSRRLQRRVNAIASSWFRFGLPGAWVALVFVCLSLTPSLLPRPQAFRGL